MTDTHKKTQPTKVRLVAISNRILLKDVEFLKHNTNADNGIITDFGTHDEFMVFPCLDKNSTNSKYKEADDITKAAGFDRILNEKMYKDILIPGIHRKKERGGNPLRSYTPTLTFASLDELTSKFPKAEIIEVKSTDKLQEEYKKSAVHNKNFINESKKAAARKDLKLSPPGRIHYASERNRHKISGDPPTSLGRG